MLIAFLCIRNVWGFFTSNSANVVRGTVVRVNLPRPVVIWCKVVHVLGNCWIWDNETPYCRIMTRYLFVCEGIVVTVGLLFWLVTIIQVLRKKKPVLVLVWAHIFSTLRIDSCMYMHETTRIAIMRTSNVCYALEQA